MKNNAPIPTNLRPWIDARQRFRLSHANVQMARELGLNPNKFGKLANHRQEPWKRPLPDFIAALYVKRFGSRSVAIPKLLDMLVIEGAILTIDAMGCQRDVATKIIAKKAGLSARPQRQSGHAARGC